MRKFFGEILKKCEKSEKFFKTRKIIKFGEMLISNTYEILEI